MSNSISEFIQRKLSVLNASKFINVPKQDDYISRVREAVIKSNSLMERVSIEVNGVDVSKEILNQTKIAMPDAFKRKPVMYESFAADGSVFSLEVS